MLMHLYLQLRVCGVSAGDDTLCQLAFAAARTDRVLAAQPAQRTQRIATRLESEEHTCTYTYTYTCMSISTHTYTGERGAYVYNCVYMQV